MKPIGLTPVVYTMGKVGSSAISSAVRNAGLECFDIHSLDPDSLKKHASLSLQKGHFPAPHVCTSILYRKRLLKSDGNLYITLVREPIARNLSAFFQNAWLYLPDNPPSELAAEVFQQFLASYGHNIPISWFTREFDSQLGIDIYATPFDYEARYTFIPSRNTLVLRSDCPDEEKSEILSRLLGRSITVGRDNSASGKDYHALYTRVKEVAAFAPEFVSKMYDTVYARHFWTKEELSSFRAKWLGQGASCTQRYGSHP